MASFVAVFDACVLYPAPLRDLLLRLALTDLFRARWSAEIHDEWVRAVLARRPDLSPAILDRTRALMDGAVPDAVVTGHEGLIPTLTLPDPDDRHVLAAAIRCQAGVIVTFNLRTSRRRLSRPTASRRSIPKSSSPISSTSRPARSVARSGINDWR